MSATTTLEDLNLPRKHPPSLRDREIYAAVMVDQSPQADVGRRFAVSQPRVAQIVQRVEDWMHTVLGEASRHQPGSTAAGEAGDAPGEELDPSTFERDLTTAERLRLAEHIAIERMEYVYGAAITAWRKSQEDSCERRSRQVRGEMIEECIRKTQSGKPAFLNQAMRAALASARLVGVDTTGREARKLAAAEQQAAKRERERRAAAGAEIANVTCDRSGDRAEAPSVTPAQTTYNRENSRGIAPTAEEVQALETLCQELAASVDDILLAAA